mmetsp:Transcript_21076/g.28974  ORF Transcript_21076/g.28974 Transcript_21076/m.28974 type:complete len:227 (+) Transcript_21076:454-1134(+)
MASETTSQDLMNLAPLEAFLISLSTASLTSGFELSSAVSRATSSAVPCTPVLCGVGPRTFIIRWASSLVISPRAASSSGFTTTRAPRNRASWPTRVIWSTALHSPVRKSSMGCGAMFSPLLSTMVSLARPVMIRSPVAGLIMPRSPVSKKPSLSMAFCVASGLFMYSDMICGPLAMTTPALPAGSSLPVSGSVMRSVVPGGGLPTLPMRLASHTRLEITGEVSVSP